MKKMTEMFFALFFLMVLVTPGFADNTAGNTSEDKSADVEEIMQKLEDGNLSIAQALSQAFETGASVPALVPVCRTHGIPFGQLIVAAETSLNMDRSLALAALGEGGASQSEIAAARSEAIALTQQNGNEPQGGNNDQEGGTDNAPGLAYTPANAGRQPSRVVSLTTTPAGTPVGGSVSPSRP